MKGRLGRLGDALAGNLWLIPLLSFLLAFVLSRGLEWFDRSYDVSEHAWFVYGGSPQGSRQLLSTVAGSMITFIGMVFSSTILVLQLASSQFSPRVMRSFFRDRIIQVTLGTFIATFAYAILVLREIREDPAHPFVPGLSTYVAISLVWLSLGMFVVYIHHIAQRIRAINVIKIASDETLQCLQRLDRVRPPEAHFVKPQKSSQLVTSVCAGVVADIDAAAILRLATKQDLLVEVIPLPGDYLCSGSPVARIWGTSPLNDSILKQIVQAVSVEHERTMRDDVLFGLRQLVDIADKALSPGINDPTTAVQVLDQIHELLQNIARAQPRADVYRDSSGAVRAFVPRPTWEQYVDHALEEILLYGRDSIHVLRRLRTLTIDLSRTVQESYRPVIAAYLNRIETCIDEAFTLPADKEAARRLPAATQAKVVS